MTASTTPLPNISGLVLKIPLQCKRAGTHLTFRQHLEPAHAAPTSVPCDISCGQGDIFCRTLGWTTLVSHHDHLALALGPARLADMHVLDTLEVVSDAVDEGKFAYANVDLWLTA